MPDPRSRHFRIETLAPGVGAAIATPGGFGLCNAGIIDLGDQTVVFDTMLTPMAGEDLVRAAERATGRRPAWVINSHWHGDHIWGNSAFAGTPIVSSRTVRTNIQTRSRVQFEEDRRTMRRELPTIDGTNSAYPTADRKTVAGWFAGVLASPRKPTVCAPTVTFENGLVLEGSRRTLHVRTFGGGHSPSDVFAFLPDEGVLFAGDLALRGLHPSLGDGRPASWISILRRMERLGAHSIVPGHGPSGPRATLSVTRNYLEELVRMARAALRDRVSSEEFARTAVPARYRSWGFSFMFPGNLSRAYRFARAESRRRSGRSDRPGPGTSG